MITVHNTCNICSCSCSTIHHNSLL